MQTQKMSLANIKGKLSRAEMKNVMAGSGDGWPCINDSHCWGGWVTCGGAQYYVAGSCRNFRCYLTAVC